MPLTVCAMKSGRVEKGKLSFVRCLFGAAAQTQVLCTNLERVHRRTDDLSLLWSHPQIPSTNRCHLMYETQLSHPTWGGRRRGCRCREANLLLMLLASCASVIRLPLERAWRLQHSGRRGNGPGSMKHWQVAEQLKAKHLVQYTDRHNAYAAVLALFAKPWLLVCYCRYDFISTVIAWKHE
jgi:hypothetical protein